MVREWPSLRRRSARWEPMKPAPPGEKIVHVQIMDLNLKSEKGAGRGRDPLEFARLMMTVLFFG